jgi:hypothetical protein
VSKFRNAGFFAIWMFIWVAAWAAEQTIFPASNGAIGGTLGFFAGVIAASYLTGVGTNQLRHESAGLLSS